MLQFIRIFLLLNTIVHTISFTVRHSKHHRGVWKMSNSPDSDLKSKLVEISKSTEKLSTFPTFQTMATDSEFINTIWQRKPFLCDQSLQNIEQSYVSTDLKTDVDNDFIEAGRGSFEEGRTGWNMKSVSQPRGSSFQDAKLRFEDIEVALKERSGTVVVNSAGGFIPRMASVCLDALRAFQLPVALNMYVTNPGQKTSAPPHTDKQDVFVLQSQGRKRWRVYAPPPPARMIKADPLARGKSSNILDLSELEVPLIDIVLYPGQILYVPAGFPHTTDTVTAEANESTEPSLHMTLGVDTHIWYLNFASLRMIALKRARLPDKLTLTKLEPSLYWDLQSTLPLGFLHPTTNDDPMSMPTPEHVNSIVQTAVQKFRQVEPNRWSADISDDTIAQSMDLHGVVMKLAEHRLILVDIFNAMYSDVAFKITQVRMDLSFFRSQPYFKALEEQMESIDAWMNLKPMNLIDETAESAADDKKKVKNRSSKGFGSKK